MCSSDLQEEIDRQEEWPQDLVLAGVVALVHKQAWRDGDGGNDDAPEGDRAEPAAGQKEPRESAVRGGHEQTIFRRGEC